MHNALWILLFPSLVILTGCPSALNRAIYREDTVAAREMIEKGADVNKQDPINSYTPLHYAASTGNLELIRLLLDRGANIDARGISKITPLYFAIVHRQVRAAKLLVEKGADLEHASELCENETNSLMGWTKTCPVVIAKLKSEMASAVPSSSVTATATKGMPVSALSDVDQLPAAAVKQNPAAYAIVIGIESYRQKLPRADFADADAKTVSAYLNRVLGYPEENIVLLVNDRALKSDLEKYIEKWLSNKVDGDSTVFIYYSGHGAPNPRTGDAFLVPYDGDPSFIDQTGYSLRRMYEALGKLPAREIVVVLDSCFSGAGGRSVLAKGARPLVINLNAGATPAKNMTILAASSGEQISSTYDEKGHGLFTYFFLKGIRNENVVDQNGSLKLNELYRYVKPQVEVVARNKYNNEQTPQLIEGKR